MVFMVVISFRNNVRTAKQRRSPETAAFGCAGLSVEAHWLPLTPEHGFPSLFFTTRHEALPSCPPKLNWGMPFSLPFQTKIRAKKQKPPDLAASVKMHVVTGIPTLALSKSGYRSKVTPSSQPVLQAPVCFIVNMYCTSISHTLQDFFR